MNSQLQRYLYKKAAELQFQESHNNEQLKEVVIANDARIKTIHKINYADMTKKNSDLRDITSDRQSDTKASNLVSTFYVIDQYLTRTTFSSSDIPFILLSVIYKVINQLYDERKMLHTSMNQKIEETQMTATTAQLDTVTKFHAKKSVSIHKINAISSKHKLRMKYAHATREIQMNQLVSLNSEVYSDQNNTTKLVSAVVR